MTTITMRSIATDSCRAFIRLAYSKAKLNATKCEMIVFSRIRSPLLVVSLLLSSAAYRSRLIFIVNNCDRGDGSDVFYLLLQEEPVSIHSPTLAPASVAPPLEDRTGRSKKT